MGVPLVSIITITRNRASLLKRCITSVLSQSYTNIEHIVVDGASDDNTDEVVAQFKDKRLRFERLSYNWPIKQTMDHAIELCKGKYITFLDSDDEYLPTKVEKQVALLESLPKEYGFIYCWMTYFDNSTMKIVRTHETSLRGDVSEASICSPVISGTPTLMFRSEVLREVGGWLPVEEIGIGSDWELCARVCQKYMVDYVPESLVNVYINHGSVRQSEGAYYEQLYERVIKFHHFFLREYATKFKANPKLTAYHYYSMSRIGFKCHHSFEATKNLLIALSRNPRLVIRETSKMIKNKRR